MRPTTTRSSITSKASGCSDPQPANSWSASERAADRTEPAWPRYAAAKCWWPRDDQPRQRVRTRAPGSPERRHLLARIGRLLHAWPVGSDEFSCTEGEGGSGPSFCNDSAGTSTVSGGNGHLDTSEYGPHTYTVTVMSADGLQSTTSVTYTVVGSPTAAVVAPAPGEAYTLGQSVPTTFGCNEGIFGPGLASCNDSTGTSALSGGNGHLDTSTAGSKTYTVTATSTDGLTIRRRSRTRSRRGQRRQ